MKEITRPHGVSSSDVFKRGKSKYYYGWICRGWRVKLGLIADGKQRSRDMLRELRQQYQEELLGLRQPAAARRANMRIDDLIERHIDHISAAHGSLSKHHRDKKSRLQRFQEDTGITHASEFTEVVDRYLNALNKRVSDGSLSMATRDHVASDWKRQTKSDPPGKGKLTHPRRTATAPDPRSANEN